MAAEPPGAVAAADVIGTAEAAEAARALAPLLPPALVPAFGRSFIRSDRLYDEFVARLALRVFRETGLADAAREPGTAAEIARRAGFEVSRAEAPVDWILRKLASRGVIERTAGAPRRFRAPGSLPELDPAPIREEQLRENASWLPSYVLAETVAHDYPAFFRGERTGEEILFSPARLRLWVDFFSNDNGMYAVNNLVGAVAAAEWLPPGPLRILELGGGLGSAAVALLERIRDTGRWKDVVEYRFTDVVPAFLRRGQHVLERRFPEASFLRFATLDMNQPFRAQGVEAGSFSLVHAVNTVHVARELDFTLRQILDALARGGVLAISECVRLFPEQAIYAEFVFNLLESFRSPVFHPAYRPNGGFLTPANWRGAMEAAGFAGIRVMPDIDRLREACPDFYVGAIGATRA